MSKNDLTKCPKCGSYNIMGSREFNNAWVQCDDCGYYLRKPNKMEGLRNKKEDKLKNYETTSNVRRSY